MARTRVVGALGMVAFAIGVVVGLALSVIAVWGDLEASMFDPSLSADTQLSSLACPVMIAVRETGTARATFENPTDKRIERNIRTHISEGYVTLMREVNTKLPLDPGEKRQQQWTVSASDAAFGRLILMRVYVFRASTLASQQGACGILVVNVPGLTGRQITGIGIAACLLGMGLGAGMWGMANRPLRQRTLRATGAMVVLAAVVLAAILVSFLGEWVPGIALLVLAVLLIGGIVSHFTLSS